MNKEPLKIRVTTYSRKIRQVENTCYTAPAWVFESEKVIDHNNSSDRKWLGTHAFWAVRNNRRVVTEPLTLAPIPGC